VTRSTDRRRILDRWDRSGLSAAAFAPSAGLSPWTLYAWRRRERELVGHSSLCTAIVPAFVELAAAAEHASNREDCTARRIEILLPRDIVIRVQPGFDTAELRRIVDALVA